MKNALDASEQRIQDSEQAYLASVGDVEDQPEPANGRPLVKAAQDMFDALIAIDASPDSRMNQKEWNMLTDAIKKAKG